MASAFASVSTRSGGCEGPSVVVSAANCARSRKADYGPALASLIELRLQQRGTDYQKTFLRREAFRCRVRALFEAVALLVIPAQSFVGRR